MYEKTYNNMTLYTDQNQYKNIEKVSPPRCCFNSIFSFCSKFWKQKHKKTANTKFWMFEIPPKSTQEINFLPYNNTFALIKFCAMVLRKRSDSEHSHFLFCYSHINILCWKPFWWYTKWSPEWRSSCPKYFMHVAVTAA